MSKSRQRASLATPLLLAALCGACGNTPDQAPVIGEAFAGPATLNLRQEITPRSRTVATVKHGERLQIVQRKRRFVKVRTPQRVEGWTDDRLLLTPEQITGLRQSSEMSRSLPSMGVATTHDTLNVHIEPNRLSPSFLQVTEGEKVDVIGYRTAARVAPTPPKRPFPTSIPPSKKKARIEGSASKRFPPPPTPAPPRPPSNWIDLFKSATVPETSVPEERQPIPLDDWALIRTATGQSGWVLTGRLFMAIPDEVAQYAEGRRITSYFSLGQVQDGSDIKHHWLWTTIEKRNQPYQFDSFRVFVWNLRRHHYETAHIERNLKGYFPVLLHPVELAQAGARRKAASYPGFSLMVEQRDGSHHRRSYAFLGTQVRFAGMEPVTGAGSGEPPSGFSPSIGTQAGDVSKKSFADRWKENFHAWWKRVFGR